MKNFLKSILPGVLVEYLKRLGTYASMKKAYCYDLNRYHENSRTQGRDTKEKLIGEIIAGYHVVEKGLTMPEPRLGFGRDRIVSLCELCLMYIDNFGLKEKQFQHAVQVILEYEDFHRNKKYDLDTLVAGSIAKVKELTGRFSPCSQRRMTKQEFFQHRFHDFASFSNSRASVRNFTSEEITSEKIFKVLNLVRNTPSACNRQSSRVDLFTSKKQIIKILEVQGGNRGFGHLTNKLIVITGELGVFNGIAERNQVFVDGGMYAMNLLYSLHFHEIAACILNCSLSPKKDQELRRLCNINESRVFVAMIACGVAPNEFQIARSERHELDIICKITN